MRILTIALSLFSFMVGATTHIIPTTQTVVDGKNIKPGDTVVLAGQYTITPYFKNISGTVSKRIVIINKGQVNVGPMKFDNCKYFKLTGNQKDKFVVSGGPAGSSGINIYNRSTDFEVAYLEIHTTGFAGIMAKDDGAKAGQFTMQNIKLHHLLIHDTSGEGLYIGSTSANGHELANVEIFQNRITNTGWDGMQLGHCIVGASIHDNYIENTGTKKEQFQGNGIQIGLRTGGLCFNNVIKTTFGNGIIVMGSGANVYKNRIYLAGENGIFADDRPDTKEGFKFTGNEIVSPKVYCLSLHTSKEFKNEVRDNMLVRPGGYNIAMNTNRNPFLEVDKEVTVKITNNLSSMDTDLAAYLINRN